MPPAPPVAKALHRRIEKYVQAREEALAAVATADRLLQ